MGCTSGDIARYFKVLVGFVRPADALTPCELVNSVMMRPRPPRLRMKRRKTVSVTPAMGARTVAGATRTLPIRTSEGTQTSSGMACERGLSQDLRIGNGLILPGKSEYGGRKGDTEGHGAVLCDLRSCLRDLRVRLISGYLVPVLAASSAFAYFLRK